MNTESTRTNQRASTELVVRLKKLAAVVTVATALGAAAPATGNAMPISSVKLSPLASKARSVGSLILRNPGTRWGWLQTAACPTLGRWVKSGQFTVVLSPLDLFFARIQSGMNYQAQFRGYMTEVSSWAPLTGSDGTVRYLVVMGCAPLP